MKIIEHKEEFKTGVRIVMKVLRGKDGGLAKPDHHADKIITRSPEQWDAAVAKFVTEAEPLERIYASLDPRDMEKAIWEFQRRQLDAQLYDENAKHGFYVDVRNRFISCLAGPKCRESKRFLIDCDTPAEADDAMLILAQRDLLDKVVETYETKNGTHIITEPFNPSLMQMLKDKVQQNALLLVGYPE